MDLTNPRGREGAMLRLIQQLMVDHASVSRAVGLDPAGVTEEEATACAGAEYHDSHGAAVHITLPDGKVMLIEAKTYDAPT
jgi:hypothetical protein